MASVMLILRGKIKWIWKVLLRYCVNCGGEGDDDDDDDDDEDDDDDDDNDDEDDDTCHQPDIVTIVTMWLI